MGSVTVPEIRRFSLVKKSHDFKPVFIYIRPVAAEIKETVTSLATPLTALFV